jgi:hypothetical protein
VAVASLQRRTFSSKASQESPGKDDERVGTIAAQEEYVVRVEPLLELRETRPIPARLHLSHERRSVATEWIQIDIVPGAEPPLKGYLSA